MNKQAFLEGLAGYLDALDPEEIKKTCAYYAEMIDDRVEEGMDEEQAVASLEPLPVIAKEILSQAPLGNLIRARARTGRRLSGGAIALIAIGSPIWLPVALAVLAVGLTLYLVFWVLVLCLFVLDATLALSGPLMFIRAFGAGGGANLVFCIGMGLTALALAVLAFPCAMGAAKGTLWLGKWLLRKIKAPFIRKEVA